MHQGVWSCIVSAAETWTVGVTGATGYAGGEVCRLLAGHPNLRLAGVHANSSAGRRLGELQPHLLPFADMTVQPSDAALLSGYDVVVLALPHAESAAIADQLQAETVVVDCGAHHRLADAASRKGPSSRGRRPPAPARTWSCARCRTARRRRSRTSCRPRPSSSTAGPTTGWPTRRPGRGGTAACTPGPGPTACRNCRGSG